ncbi:MAG: diacylglycerol kinase family protein, partial [Stellaceae bacterium]
MLLDRQMRRRFFLVDNTVAGYGRRTLAAQVVALLEGGGAEVRRCAAAGEQQVLELTAQAARSGQFDAAIAAGGDGTIRLA